MQVERDPLAASKMREPGPLHVIDVHEDIVAALDLDEADALRVIEPFHLPLESFVLGGGIVRGTRWSHPPFARASFLPRPIRFDGGVCTEPLMSHSFDSQA